MALADLDHARALQQQAWQTGERSILAGLDTTQGKSLRQGVGDILQATTANLRAGRKTGPFVPVRNFTDDVVKLLAQGYDPLQYARDAKEMVMNNPTALPALRAAGGDADKLAQATYDQLPARIRAKYDPELANLIHEAGGVDYANDPTDLGAANVHPGFAFARGMGMGLLSPKLATFGPFTPLVSGFEQSTLPMRQALQQSFVRPFDIAARMVPAEPEVDQALAGALPGFLQKVKAAGQDITPLVAKPPGADRPGRHHRPGPRCRAGDHPPAGGDPGRRGGEARARQLRYRHRLPQDSSTPPSRAASGTWASCRSCPGPPPRTRSRRSKRCN